VWAMAVVVVDEDAKHVLKLPASDDEEPVEALGADGADEALGDGVRLRRPERRPHNLESAASEHAVEATGELAVSIVDEEAQRRGSFGQRPRQVARLLSNPRPARICGAAGEVQAVAVELDEEEHVQPPEPERVDREVVAGDLACACARKNSRQESPAARLPVPVRPGAGSLVAETRRPRPLTSPTIC
jgi:hypothetical protein